MNANSRNQSRRPRVTIAAVALGSALAIGSAQDVSASPYVTAKKCRACHVTETRGWEQTKMSKAFELLKPGVRTEAKKSHGLDPDKDYTKDSKCLGCHTTGYQKGGFESVESTPDLAGVTCEVCHGAGGDYTKSDVMSLTNKEYKLADAQKAGLVVPDAKTCEACHNAQSPFADKATKFNFEQRRKDGVHLIAPLKYNHK